MARDENGWRVQSTSRAAGTIGLDVRRLEITSDGPIRARRVSLLVIRDIPTPIEIWVAQGMLLRADLPLDRLSIVRDDIAR